MNIGTKSLLFGVHQFLWHPISVGLAWRKCYKVWPRWNELIAIFCHDIGYWGKSDMDGDEGQTHPERGAGIARKLVIFLSGDEKLASETYWLSLYHSVHYAQESAQAVSKLYLPDKVSILFEPRWWYLLRAKASGEVYEYLQNAPPEADVAGIKIYKTPVQWFGWYKEKVTQKLNQHLCS